jgi:hypothetical protein
MNQNSIFNRIYYIFLFLSLVALVFYLGYLFGIREEFNNKDNEVSVINPNGSQINSISGIQQRPIIGSEDFSLRTYGQVYFLTNSQKQTEIFISLQDVPARVTNPQNGNSVAIPQELSLDVARLDGQDFSYENINTNPEIISYIALNQPVEGRRSGTYTGIIDEAVFDPDTGNQNIRRLVFRDVNKSRQEAGLETTEEPVENIFIDTNTNLPVGVRGNPEAGIPGEPAPFFWVEF